jgi:hypothetical protein
MNALKLYRMLLAHVSAMNALVVALYKEEIAPEDAHGQAVAALEKTIKDLQA